MSPQPHGWDRDILETIVGTAEAGATIEDILGGVDARQKVLLGLEELNDSLTRLTANDLIVERGAGRFTVPTADDPRPSSFVLVDPEAYQAAVDAYHAWFVDTLRHLGDAFSDPDASAWPKLSATWRFSDEHYASDLEIEGLWSIVDRVVAALTSHGFTVEPGPSSVGPGTIEFSIYARQTDDAEAMLRVARPVFAAAAPATSTIEVDEWDPRSVGPPMSQVADDLEHQTIDPSRLPPSA